MRRRRADPAAPYDVDLRAAVARLRTELADVRELLHDARKEKSAAYHENAGLRRRVTELERQLRAAAAIVAAAERECGENCAHVRVATELRVQRDALNERLAELTRASQRRDVLDFAARNKSADWEPRPTVPRQRGTT